MNGLRVDFPKTGPGSFRVKELWGSLFDLWFLIPIAGLMVVSEQGGSAASLGRDLLVMGGGWLLSAFFFRTSLPLQPLKVWAFLFLILRPTVEVVSLSAVLLGLLLFLSSQFELSSYLEARLSDRSFARIRKSVTLYVWWVTFLAFVLVHVRHFPGRLPLGLASLFPGIYPPPFLSVFLLVLAQFPVTFVNGILATVQERRKDGVLSNSAQKLLTGKNLSCWLGVANLLAGVAGGLPFCHGAGNLWVYRRHGIRSLFPSLFSSTVLTSLGIFLIRGEIPLFSPLVYGAFLAGFLFVEHLLKKETKASMDAPLARDCSRHDPFEIWAMAGGVVSGAIFMGGLPLLLILLLGMNTAGVLLAGGTGERISPVGKDGSGGVVAVRLRKPVVVSEREGLGPNDVYPVSASVVASREVRVHGALPIPFFLKQEMTGIEALPERFLRRARKINAEVFMLVLLLSFSFVFDLFPSLLFFSNPGRSCRQKKIYFLLTPLRAP